MSSVRLGSRGFGGVRGLARSVSGRAGSQLRVGVMTAGAVKLAGGETGGDLFEGSIEGIQPLL